MEVARKLLILGVEGRRVKDIFGRLTRYLLKIKNASLYLVSEI
jgi:hypothetical protein